MHVKPKYQKIVRCSLVGDGFVGKTSLVTKFTKDELRKNYEATVFDNFAGSLSVAGDKYTVSVFDTAGQPDYEGIRIFAYNETDVIVVCYSCVDRESFNNVRRFWAPEVRSHVKTKKPIILISTQTDLRATDAEQDAVSRNEGLELAKKVGAEHFIECSVSDKKSVNAVFEHVVMSALKKKNKKKKCYFIQKLFGHLKVADKDDGVCVIQAD